MGKLYIVNYVSKVSTGGISKVYKRAYNSLQRIVARLLFDHGTNAAAATGRACDQGNYEGDFRTKNLLSKFLNLFIARGLFFCDSITHKWAQKLSKGYKGKKEVISMKKTHQVNSNVKLGELLTPVLCFWWRKDFKNLKHLLQIVALKPGSPCPTHEETTELGYLEHIFIDKSKLPGRCLFVVGKTVYANLDEKHRFNIYRDFIEYIKVTDPGADIIYFPNMNVGASKDEGKSNNRAVPFKGEKILQFVNAWISGELDKNEQVIKEVY